jgi:hypothetical protein
VHGSIIQSTKYQTVEAVILLLIASFLFSGMAFYNGYPLVFYDTAFYIGWHNLSCRSILYNYFISPSLWFHSLWPVVFFQSLIVAHLLRLVLRVVFGIMSPLLFLLLTVLLCLLTSLPSFTGFIMPDIFAAVLILSLYLLVFCREGLGSWEKGYLFILTFIAAGVHLAHIPLAIGILFLAWIFRLSIKNSRLPIPKLAGVSVSILLALLILMANNYRTQGLFILSPGGYAFILARLVDDGPAMKYLQEHCAERNYALCAYLDEMPSFDSYQFLWNIKSPFHKVGHIDGYRQEGSEIVRETFLHYPFQVMKLCISNTFRQLFMIKNGGWRPDLSSPYPTRAIQMYFPDEFRSYTNALQSRKMLPLKTLDYLYTTVSLLSLLIAIAAFFIFLKRRMYLPAMLLIFITCAYIIHAFLNGAISVPNDRHGSRIIWLLPFFSIASLMHLIKYWKNYSGTSPQPFGQEKSTHQASLSGDAESGVKKRRRIAAVEHRTGKKKRSNT